LEEFWLMALSIDRLIAGFLLPILRKSSILFDPMVNGKKGKSDKLYRSWVKMCACVIGD
jgi:hypothetical protein